MENLRRGAQDLISALENIFRNLLRRSFTAAAKKSVPFSLSAALFPEIKTSGAAKLHPTFERAVGTLNACLHSTKRPD